MASLYNRRSINPGASDSDQRARERNQSREERVDIFSLARVLLAFSPSACYLVRYEFPTAQWQNIRPVRARFVSGARILISYPEFFHCPTPSANEFKTSFCTPRPSLKFTMFLSVPSKLFIYYYPLIKCITIYCVGLTCVLYRWKSSRSSFGIPRRSIT